MLYKISKHLVLLILVLSIVGCQPKASSPDTSSTQELRLLTPEQEKKILEQAEKVEQKELVRQPIKNAKGEVIGTVTSQTTVVYLKGGGRFNMNAACSNTCSGTPTNLDPSLPTNACGCNSKCDTCTGPKDTAGCSGNCSKATTGFGNFGIFIAMEREDPLNNGIALK